MKKWLRLQIQNSLTLQNKNVYLGKGKKQRAESYKSNSGLEAINRLSGRGSQTARLCPRSPAVSGRKSRTQAQPRDGTREDQWQDSLGPDSHRRTAAGHGAEQADRAKPHRWP